jgi:hypothetical protein
MTRRLPAALLFTFAFFVACSPLVDTDIWFHLDAGRSIVRDLRIPEHNVSTIGTFQRPWIDLHWLFQVTVYFVHQLGGVLALVLGKCALVAFGALLLLWNVEPRHRFGAAALLGIAIGVARPLLLERPVIFTLLFVGVFLLVLERMRARPEWRLVAVLFVAQALWANFQPVFLLGPIIVGCYLLGELLQGSLQKPRAMLTAAVGLTAAACLLTPYGWSGIELPLKLFSRLEPGAGALFSANVAENLPPWLLERDGEAWIAPFKFVAAAAFGSFLLCRDRLVLARLLLLTAMLVPALMANRNVLLFCWVAAPIVALNLSEAARGTTKLSWLIERGMQSPLSLVVLGPWIAIHAIAMGQEGSIAELAPFRVPVEATAVLENAQVTAEPGHVFCSERYGGWLAWRLAPRRLPVIDGRLVLLDDAQFAAYLEVLEHPRSFAAYAESYALTAAILPTVEPPHFRRLVAHLYADPAWRLIDTDGTSALFVLAATTERSAIDLDDVEPIVARLEERYRVPAVRDHALFNLATTLVELDRRSAAHRVLSRLTSADARALEARLAYLERDYALAKAISLGLLERHGEERNSLVLLALLALDAGDWAEALLHAERALALDPFDAEAKQILEEISRRSATTRR